MVQLNYRDARPFYQQIMENIRQLIVNEALKPDEKLPSVRDLASSLAINPNTIQRAYRELEAEGYVYFLAGKGTFVAPRGDGGQVRKQELMKGFEDLVQELLYLNVSAEELKDRIEEFAKKPQFDIEKGGDDQ